MNRQDIKTYTWAKDVSYDLIKDGEIQDDAVISQSIESILGTRRGERLFNLNFGSDFTLRIFDNMDPAYLERLLDDTATAIELWEDRVTILKENMRILIDPDMNSATVIIPYLINASGKMSEFKKKVLR